MVPPGNGRKEILGNTEEESELVYKYKLGVKSCGYTI